MSDGHPTCIVKDLKGARWETLLILEFMDRKLYLHLQAGREVSGVLRGFDMFLNLVVENAFEELGGGVRKPLGMIVSFDLCSSARVYLQGEGREEMSDALEEVKKEDRGQEGQRRHKHGERSSRVHTEKEKRRLVSWQFRRLHGTQLTPGRSWKLGLINGTVR